jgi:hypothetical protein
MSLKNKGVSGLSIDADMRIGGTGCISSGTKSTQMRNHYAEEHKFTGF